MQIAAALAGFFLIFLILLDAFETMILPRRVTQRVRLSKLFYRASWVPWRWVGRAIKDSASRETFLGYYGPLSLLMLVAIWVIALVFGFALIQWSLGGALGSADNRDDFWTNLYLSGSAFFTLGLGDVVPLEAPGRFIAV